MAFTLAPLPYAYEALEPHIDTETMKIHHDKHHQAYVDNLNKAVAGTENENKTIEDLVKAAGTISPAVRNNGGGHWNHTFFWESSQSKKADSTAIVVVGIDPDSNIYVLDIDRFKTDRITEYFSHLLVLHNKWGFRKMRAEVTVAQQAIVRELKESYIKPRGLYLSVDEHRPTRSDGAKEERIAAILEPKYDNLQVWHYKSGNIQSLEEELVLRNPPHDDIKDALANAIEIAIPPKQHSSQHAVDNVIFNSRFGGVSYRS